MSELLPSNSTAQERAMDDATARGGDVPVPVRSVWNADTCPAQVLPWLAWAFSVDNWSQGLTVQQQRDAVKASVEIHRHKGTIGAVREALGAIGIGMRVIEWWQDTPAAPAYTFRIEIEAGQYPVTLADMERVLEVVDRTKNVRSHLAEITPTVTSLAEVYIGGAAGVGSQITVTGTSGTLLLDGTWLLDASQIIDGFKRADTHTLDGSWSLNGATTLNGITT
jgi:phage tail P2-like protein